MATGKLGHGSYTNTELPENVTVGNYSSIAEDCYFHCWTTHLCIDNRKVVYTTNWEQPMDTRPITIGNDVWIGRGVQVLDDVTIGDGAIIGAGAVISKSVPPFAVVVGNPQRIVRYRFLPEQQAALNRIKWWNWNKETAESRIPDMKNIDTFIEKYDIVH